MTPYRLLHFLLLITLVVSLAGCNMPSPPRLPDIFTLLSTPQPTAPAGEPLATALPPPAETLVSFRAQTPPGTPPEAAVFLTVLDEVTGLAFNTQVNPMEAAEDNTNADSPVYQVTLPFPIGSLVKYRYERQADGIRVGEHLSDGSAVRYRMVSVTGEGSVEDVISRWTDTAYTLPSGRIQGQALDGESGSPIPNLLIAAGGAQTLTAADGSFMIEGLPPGVHNLIAIAMDGSYQTFQQGARVAEGSTTMAALTMNAASFVNVVFVVKVPKRTPPVVPLRMAGNLLQFGNTFGNLAAGMSVVAERMPALTMLPDGRYTITAALPVGADLRYKFTLGDGFWNAEHNKDASFRLRQLIVPKETALVEDQVITWNAGRPNSITFDVSVPADTPPDDSVSIQFNPLIGWTEPIPMWRLGESRWGYVLYSPLNLPGGFSYRYCRNGQCGRADDAKTAGADSPGRTVEMSEKPQTISDQVEAWAYWGEEPEVNLPAVEEVNGYGDGYWAGIELTPEYRPNWNIPLPHSLEQIQAIGGNWLVLSPTWGYGHGSPENSLPILSPVPGQDASWPELAETIQQGQVLDMKVALRPAPRFPVQTSEWWASAKRDESWWEVWFEQYRTFVLHHADLAARSGSSALILGGEWLAPALPDGVLADGSPSGAPADSEQRWEELFKEVRTHFQGQLLWALSPDEIVLPPAFLGLADRIYLEVNVPAGGSIDEAVGTPLDTWLDISVSAFQALSARPLILAVSCPSDPDQQIQIDCYQTLLSAANARAFVSGFVSTGYYPPAALQDSTPSTNGKPASEVLKLWYPEMIR